MEKVNRYEFEGEVIEVPVYWDDHLKRYAEDYRDYCEQPGCTCLLYTSPSPRDCS